MLPVDYTSSAKKYFKKIKDNNLKEAYKSAIISIRKNPKIGTAKTGDLKGIYCVDIFHNKVNYELAYRISILKNGKMIVVVLAGTRENFYKELKRYFDA